VTAASCAARSRSASDDRPVGEARREQATQPATSRREPAVVLATDAREVAAGAGAQPGHERRHDGDEQEVEEPATQHARRERPGPVVP
jgi:hypothetical protein